MISRYWSMTQQHTTLTPGYRGISRKSRGSFPFIANTLGLDRDETAKSYFRHKTDRNIKQKMANIKPVLHQLYSDIIKLFTDKKFQQNLQKTWTQKHINYPIQRSPAPLKLINYLLFCLLDYKRTIAGICNLDFVID